MSTCNFRTKNARYIYALEDNSQDFFEGSEWNETGFEFHGLPVSADVKIFANPGYYEGANIDYEITFEGFKLSDYGCIDDLIWNFRDDNCHLIFLDFFNCATTPHNHGSATRRISRPNPATSQNNTPRRKIWRRHISHQFFVGNFRLINRSNTSW